VKISDLVRYERLKYSGRPKGCADLDRHRQYTSSKEIVGMVLEVCEDIVTVKWFSSPFNGGIHIHPAFDCETISESR